ncbi:hypothetical protein [Novosphingobium sp.]|uniref:hypothetical protein n=1 Tax=Novosphingobium sp. TaxID=1874826 RepID=UPI0025FE2726|nr:hypothetical protein [Novosphingobium sp.]
MNSDHAPPRPADIAAPAFTPVPLARTRHDGWTVPRQSAFLRALCVTGSVSSAARMVGMSRKAAYALRARAGAESFAAAWNRALGEGRERAFDWLMERALNGVTTITLRTGGALDIGHGPDRRLVASPMRSALPGGKPTQGDLR